METLYIGHSKNVLTEFAMHEHALWEVLIGETGSGDFILEDEVIPFDERTIFVIPPYTKHCKKSEKGFTDVSVFIRDMRAIGDLGLKDLTDTDNREILTLGLMMFRIYENSGEFGEDRKTSVLNSLGEALYHMLSARFSMSRNKNLNIDPFIERMEKSCMNPDFDLAKEIDAYGYSRGYFRRAFKAATGETPVAFFNRVRIEHAAAELSRYGKSRTIREIALSCGFEDPYYFSRLFKKVMGENPTDLIEKAGLFDLKEIDEDYVEPE